MRTDIPFNEIMKNHKNWHEDVDYEAMDANYKQLKPIMNKFFFSRYPDNPKIFSLVFSYPNFAEHLINSMMDFKIRNLNKVWFDEFLTEDRDRLIEKGMLELLPTYFGGIAVFIMQNGNDVFVNVIHGELD